MTDTNLLEEFIEKCWPFGKTEKGTSKIRRYKIIYDGFMNSDAFEEEKEEENIEETSFAYEHDLQEYLARNLSTIEKGLKLYKNDGADGIEYTIFPDNKRIDILALDKDGVPVIIELKVSKGYEQVIGQCLFYRNKIKQIFNCQKVRIIIIAREISSQLKIAIEDLPDVQLFEYSLSVRLNKI